MAKIEVTDLKRSLGEMFILWTQREVTTPEGKIYASRLATGLVRVFLTAIGVYSPAPFMKDQKVVSDAREFLERYGQQNIKFLLHMAILLDRDNPHAYIYLVKCLRDRQYLWKEEYLRFGVNILPRVAQWAEDECSKRKLEDAQLAIMRMETGHPSQAHRWRERRPTEEEVVRQVKNWFGLDVWGKEKSVIRFPEIPLEEIVLAFYFRY